MSILKGHVQHDLNAIKETTRSWKNSVIDREQAAPVVKSEIERMVSKLRQRKIVDASSGYTRGPTEEEEEAALLLERLAASAA